MLRQSTHPCCTTESQHELAVAENVLKQGFTAEQPKYIINDEPLRLQKRTWDNGESGQDEVILLYSDDVLPDGEYQLDLYVKGERVQSGSCTIGDKTPKPTPTPKRPTKKESVEIYGRIVDADTGRGVASAYFVVLKPGITVADFEGDEEQVYTLAESNRQSNFRLPDPLMRGETYSIIVVAQGYRPVTEDDVYVGEEVESPLELTVKLIRAR